MRLLLTRFESVGKGRSPCSEPPRATSIAAQQDRQPLGSNGGRLSVRGMVSSAGVGLDWVSARPTIVPASGWPVLGQESGPGKGT